MDETKSPDHVANTNLKDLTEEEVIFKLFKIKQLV